MLTVPLPVFSILGISSPGPTRTQLEIRKDREISTLDCNVILGGGAVEFGVGFITLRTVTQAKINITENENITKNITVG